METKKRMKWLLKQRGEIEKELKECYIRMDLLNKKYTKKNGFLLECKGIEKVIDFIEK